MNENYIGLSLVGHKFIISSKDSESKVSSIQDIKKLKETLGAFRLILELNFVGLDKYFNYRKENNPKTMDYIYICLYRTNIDSGKIRINKTFKFSMIDGDFPNTTEEVTIQMYLINYYEVGHNLMIERGIVDNIDFYNEKLMVKMFYSKNDIEDFEELSKNFKNIKTELNTVIPVYLSDSYDIDGEYYAGF